ncbi:Transmembrane protein 258 [Camellia lanceoleosa]|uniref:Transmembrane protein 258 n=1 Tax=Camellia lanceoleosa TaxID=1840588 RepID=A0ACC0IGF2_9ERIC|nr:Transmembrane protein 258 [Camellia lanceoleosa]
MQQVLELFLSRVRTLSNLFQKPRLVTSWINYYYYVSFKIKFGQVIAVEERAQSILLIYEATSSRKNRCLAKELTTGAVASVFLDFGSLLLLLAYGVYV